MAIALAICKGVTVNLSWPIPMVTMVQEFQERWYSLSYCVVSGTLPPISLGRSTPTRWPKPNRCMYSVHFTKPERELWYSGLSMVFLNTSEKNELQECAMDKRRLAEWPAQCSKQ